MKRFWDKVDKTETCWNWTGAVQQGYGTLKVDGKTVGAHRLSWEMHFGPIPKGMLICHKCDNRLCVNPDHLFLGTHRDNLVDASLKGRVYGQKKFEDEADAKKKRKAAAKRWYQKIKKDPLKYRTLRKK